MSASFLDESGSPIVRNFRQVLLERIHIEHPDAKPSDSHENWLAEKRATGWVFGEAKAAEKKTHPCFRPYDELPGEQRRKDALFIAVVRALA